MKRSDITPSLLNELMDADFDAGRLVWKPRADNPSFTTRHAGSEALGCIDKTTGYKTGHVLGFKVKAHRALWAMAYGYWPEIIDHINGDPLDNRLDNLRSCSHSQNLMNSSRPPEALPRGVRAMRSSGKAGSIRFQARITVKGRTKHLGAFATPEEAERAYLKAVNDMHGEFAHSLRP